MNLRDKLFVVIIILTAIIAGQIGIPKSEAKERNHYMINGDKCLERADKATSVITAQAYATMALACYTAAKVEE